MTDLFITQIIVPQKIRPHVSSISSSSYVILYSMKKFLFLCFYALLLLRFIVPLASAQCSPRTSGPGCRGLKPTACQVEGSTWCCSDDTFCTNLQAAYNECTSSIIVCTGANPITCQAGGTIGTRCCSNQQACDILQSAGSSAPGPVAPAPAAGAETPTCDGGNGTPTALGCIPNEPAAAIAKILPWAIRLGTGLAFLLFLYGAFTLITAGSDPQKVDTGKSIITSAAAGLIFIILSVILLRVIGIDILQL